MTELPAAEQPSTPMRVVLAVLVGACALSTAIPLALSIAGVLIAGLISGDAVTLQHTGALGRADSFETAHWTAVIGIVLFLVGAFGFRRLNPNATGLTGRISRSPSLSACIALPLLTLLLVRTAWDTTAVAALTGPLLLADLYFLSLVATVSLVMAAARSALAVYRWASATRYRAGLMTGATALALAVLWLRGAPASSTLSTTAVGQAWLARTAAERSRPIEAERQLMLLVDGLLEPTSAALPALRRSPVVLPAAVAAEPRSQVEPFAQEATPSSETSGEARKAACVVELTTAASGPTQVLMVASSIKARYGFSWEQAKDIVLDALLNVCEAYAFKAYNRLGAVLQTAADRRASRWRNRQARACQLPPDDAPPDCAMFPDDFVRLRSEDNAINASLCAEDEVTQQIIAMRAFEEKDFETIGALVNLSADQARSKWNNARARLQKRLAALCQP